MKHLSPLLLLLLLAACSTDPGTSTAEGADMRPAAGLDMSPAADMKPAPDMRSAPAGDMRQDMRSPLDMRSALVDMRQDMSAAMTPDMRADMAPDMLVPDMRAPDMSTPDMSAPDMSAPARPSGQCSTTLDCGSAELTCNRSAVGGSCQGPCSACASIPGSATYTCVAGACVRECDGSEECPLGKYCSRGRCLIQRCSNDVCPSAIFGCTSPDGICQRRSCAGGEVCPAGTLCEAGVCMEP